MLNVFRGEMSFVGPRPERAYFVKQLRQRIAYYNVRHGIKPGITGLAQVRYRYGASVEDAVRKLQYDLYYVKNNSLFLDLLILVDTVQVVLSARRTVMLGAGVSIGRAVQSRGGGAGVWRRWRGDRLFLAIAPGRTDGRSAAPCCLPPCGPPALRWRCCRLLRHPHGGRFSSLIASEMLRCGWLILLQVLSGAGKRWLLAVAAAGAVAAGGSAGRDDAAGTRGDVVVGGGSGHAAGRTPVSPRTAERALGHQIRLSRHRRLFRLRFLCAYDAMLLPPHRGYLGGVMNAFSVPLLAAMAGLHGRRRLQLSRQIMFRSGGLRCAIPVC
jgi:hypothetical protein